jgi:hypothetical protein
MDRETFIDSMKDLTDEAEYFQNKVKSLYEENDVPRILQVIPENYREDARNELLSLKRAPLETLNFYVQKHKSDIVGGSGKSNKFKGGSVVQPKDTPVKSDASLDPNEIRKQLGIPKK